MKFNIKHIGNCCEAFPFCNHERVPAIVETKGTMTPMQTFNYWVATADLWSGYRFDRLDIRALVSALESAAWNKPSSELAIARELKQAAQAIGYWQE